MSVIPLEKVHGDHLANKELNITINNKQYLYSLDKLRLDHLSIINRISYTQVLGEPYYSFQSKTGEQLFHGVTGEPMKVITPEQAVEIAKQHYLGDGELVQQNLLDKAPMEASRNKGKVWQMQFNDTWNTTLYISPNNGKLTTIRSDLWRIFDFFWMLHIMDYDERENFNNPLLITFSVSALLFTITGIVLLFKSFNVFDRRRKIHAQQNL